MIAAPVIDRGADLRSPTRLRCLKRGRLDGNRGRIRRTRSRRRPQRRRQTSEHRENVRGTHRVPPAHRLDGNQSVERTLELPNIAELEAGQLLHHAGAKIPATLLPLRIPDPPPPLLTPNPYPPHQPPPPPPPHPTPHH